MNQTHPYFDLASHTIWANRQLISFLRTQDEQTLSVATGGTFGTILETFRHVIASEISYLTSYLRGEKPATWEGYDTAGLDELTAKVDEIEAMWREILAEPSGSEDVVVRRLRDKGEFDVKKAVLLTQAIHHANEHRAQICSMLGLLGIEPPDVSAWLYGIETGRATPVSGPGSV